MEQEGTMPKERIYAEHDPTRRAGPDDDIVQLPGVEVQWNQYSINSDEHAGVAVASGYLNEEFDEDKPKVTTPYFVWMNRRELNHLIRTLRRARAAMYGTDE